ncbi:unnamed protein product [Prorocentrum cordatum]|uniref:Uncharacterized protein n=1 Tax=Prorocentrum cordatum TaxID=2364126 RepID=A0ABN9XY88_9DINO|nr:unnamed protein product [Polarella glacialis]
MACRSGDQWQHVLALLREIWTVSLELGVVCHDVGVTAWEMGGQWRRSLSLLREAVRLRLEPNAEICGNAVCVCEAETRPASGRMASLPPEGLRRARGARHAGWPPGFRGLASASGADGQTEHFGWAG